VVVNDDDEFGLFHRVPEKQAFGAQYNSELRRLPTAAQ
jgi:hypothetical protein